MQSPELPDTAVLEVTWRCSHTCKFCSCPWFAAGSAFQGGATGDLPIEEWIRILDVLREAGVRRIALTGGEATLRDDLVMLASEARSRFGRVVLNTNGEHITRRLADVLFPHVDAVGVSAPGLSAFSDMTGGHSPESALRAIRTLRNRGLPVTANICVTRPVLAELFETMAEALLAGATGVLLNRFLVGGRGLTYAEELELKPGQILQMIMTAEDVLATVKRTGWVGTELPLCIRRHVPLEWLRIGSGCSGGKDFFAVDPGGGIRPCNHSPKTCGDIWHWRDAVQSPEWPLYSKRFLPQGCSACGASDECQGGCREASRIAYGTLDSPDRVFAGRTPHVLGKN